MLLTAHSNLLLRLKKKQSYNFTTNAFQDLNGLLQVEGDCFMWKMQYPVWDKRRVQWRVVDTKAAADIHIPYTRTLCGTEKHVQSP